MGLFRTAFSSWSATLPATPVTVYSGPLGSMPERGLGTLGPGQVRIYRFEANLPEGGTSDDAYAGAARQRGLPLDAVQ